VVSHDPEQLLADYARLQGEAQVLRDELRDILAKSLGACRNNQVG
jgi:type I restriction enzyme M protein